MHPATIPVTLLLAVALLAGCLSDDPAGSDVPSEPGTPSPSPSSTASQAPGPDGLDPWWASKSDHSKDFDLGQRKGGAFVEVGAGVGMPDERTRMVTSFTQPEGAAVIVLDWRNATESYAPTLSIVGAFLKDGKIVQDATDSWFFGRIVYPGDTAIDYRIYQWQFHGELITSLNDSLWADNLRPGNGEMTRTNYDSPESHSARHVALVFAWKMPVDATEMALAVCMYCDIDKEVDQETVLARLAEKTTSHLLLDPPGEAVNASMAYWASHDYYGNARMTEGKRNVEVTDTWEVNATDVAFLDRNVTAHAELSALRGWSEAYVWWQDMGLQPAEFDFVLHDGDHVHRTHEGEYGLTGPYGVEFGGINDNGTFREFWFSMRQQVAIHRPDSPHNGQGESPQIHLYAVQTDLAVAEALGQAFHPTYVANP